MNIRNIVQNCAFVLATSIWMSAAACVKTSCQPDSDLPSEGFQCVYVFDGCLPIPSYFSKRTFSTGETLYEATLSASDEIDTFGFRNTVEIGDISKFKFQPNPEIEYHYEDFTVHIFRTLISGNRVHISIVLFDENEYVLIGALKIDPWVQSLDRFRRCGN